MSKVKERLIILVDDILECYGHLIPPKDLRDFGDLSDKLSTEGPEDLYSMVNEAFTLDELLENDEYELPDDIVRLYELAHFYYGG